MITLTDADHATGDTVAATPTPLTAHLQTVFAALDQQRCREDVPAAKLGSIARAMAVVDLFRQVSEGVGEDVGVDDFGAAAGCLYRWYCATSKDETVPQQFRQHSAAVASAWSEVIGTLPAMVVNAVDYDRSNLVLIRILRLWTLAVRALVAAAASSPSPQHGMAALSLLNVVANEAAVMAVEWR